MNKATCMHVDRHTMIFMPEIWPKTSEHANVIAKVPGLLFHARCSCVMHASHRIHGYVPQVTAHRSQMQAGSSSVPVRDAARRVG